jgi:glycosyltransferase involved in cell wall biosynthesis
VLALDVGGLERIVLDLTRASRAAGQRVSIVCVDRRGTLAAEAEQLGAGVVSLDKPPGRDGATHKWAAAVLNALKPDIVHTHQVGALLYLGPAARAARIPLLHTEHGNLLARQTRWFARLKARVVLNRAARFADCFCCVSDEISLAVTRFGIVPRHRVEVAVNGVRTELFADRSGREDMRRSLGIPPDARVVGTLGRLDEVKRQDLLVRAAAKLLPRFHDFHLLLVGDGPCRPSLEAEAVRLGIAEHVRFAGYQPRPETFFSAMDVFALTSRSEGFPVSLLEAWAAGLPAVCSDVGAIPRLLTPGVNGLIFPSGDGAALCDRLTRLLEDLPAAEGLGRAGQAFVAQQYSLERMSAEYSARYQDLIAAAARSR